MMVLWQKSNNKNTNEHISLYVLHHESVEPSLQTEHFTVKGDGKLEECPLTKRKCIFVRPGGAVDITHEDGRAWKIIVYTATWRMAIKRGTLSTSSSGIYSLTSIPNRIFADEP